MRRKKTITWFITGCSTGFGRELAKAVLASGYRAVITARDVRHIKDLRNGYESRALLLRLDVTDPLQVAEAVERAKEEFGSIDVLVNNAGIGYFGAVEESDESHFRRLFEIDFFGLSRMIHAVLPGMRAERRGHIINISSIAGLAPLASLGYYCAAKFAVEGLSECLAAEVRPLGINVTLVEPSGFRTDWAGRSANETAGEIADYAETAGAVRRQLREQSGKQPGDPVRAAKAIIQAFESSQPPLHLLLGRDALHLARQKLDALRTDFDAWESVTIGADFPPDESQAKPAATQSPSRVQTSQSTAAVQ